MSEVRDSIRAALDAANGRACYTCSFQLEDVLLLDYLRAEQPDIPVIFLETGYHFPATYAYRDRLEKDWGLRLINAAAAKTVAEQEAERGQLYSTDPAACCQLRKVEPLFAALENYDVWFTGLRREQSPTRAKLEVFETAKLRSGREIQKVSPLAHWTWKQIWAEAKQRNIPVLSLYAEGYTSIGCEPCTAKPVSEDNLRSGRWGGKKLECGIHTFSPESGS